MFGFWRANWLIFEVVLLLNCRLMSAEQPPWEKLFNDLSQLVSGDFLVKQLRFFSGSYLHEAGSHANTLFAEKLASDWRKWHWPFVRTLNYSVRLPQKPPKEGPWNNVELIDQFTNQTIDILRNYSEICVSLDPSKKECGRKRTSCQVCHHPNYIGYSCSGHALGRPAFINYARRSDLAVFAAASGGSADEICSPDVIVVARHGWNNLASKVRNLVRFCSCDAKSSKCLPGGLLVYPDPADVVPNDGKLYPNGIGLPKDAAVFRSASMAQMRGGDVETPNLPAIDGVYKTEKFADVALTPIPVQTITYEDALKIFIKMRGPKVPISWRPCLATALGPYGSVLVNMTVVSQVPASTSTIVNVFGMIPGTSNEAGQYVVFGNHRDAWTLGASDPGSGNVILQHTAFLVGLAYSRGWRPRRSVLIVSWDAEEVSLVGSTETAEQWGRELSRRAVVYLNQDCPIKGDALFSARTSELLDDALIAAARDVFIDASQGMENISFLDDWKRRQGRGNDQLPLTSPLGGSTDHVPFQFKLGVPSMYPEFRPPLPLYSMPAYHTFYDTVDMAIRITDPESSHGGPLPLHRLLTKYNLNLILQFSSSPLLPISASKMAASMLLRWKQLKQFVKPGNHGLDLGVMTRRLEEFWNASKRFDGFAKYVSHEHPKCLHRINEISGEISKHFVSHLGNAAPRYILVDSAFTSDHAASYFPHLQNLLEKLSYAKSDNLIKLLKVELSVIAAALDSASNWLQGGIFGSLSPLLIDC